MMDFMLHERPADSVTQLYNRFRNARRQALIILGVLISLNLLFIASVITLFLVKYDVSLDNHYDNGHVEGSQTVQFKLAYPRVINNLTADNVQLAKECQKARLFDCIFSLSWDIQHSFINNNI